jgi:hypothetical protein
MISAEQLDTAQQAFDDAQADYQNMPPAARRAVDELGDLLAVHAGYGEND